MTFSASETTFTESTDGGTTTRTSTTPTEGDFFGASVALSEADVGEHRKVEVNGRTVDVIAFPGDTTWAAWATSISTTVAALEKRPPAFRRPPTSSNPRGPPSLAAGLRRHVQQDPAGYPG